jgi:hypothetical protein
MVKDFHLAYSNGAYIENTAESAEWQKLVCPCRPKEPFRFKLREKARIHVLADNEVERTHFSLTARKWAHDAAAS